MPKKTLIKTKKARITKNTKEQKELVAIRTDALMTIRGYLPTLSKQLDNTISISMMKGTQWSAYDEDDAQNSIAKFRILLNGISRQMKTAEFPKLKDLPGSDYEEEDNGE